MARSSLYHVQAPSPSNWIKLPLTRPAGGAGGSKLALIAS